jgi:hypothetical protein
MSTINLANEDAIELAELLRFLNGWLTSDHDHLDASLHRYVGHPSYHLERLTTDWPASPSCSATTPTASSSSPPRPHSRHHTNPNHDRLDSGYPHNAENSAPDHASTKGLYNPADAGSEVVGVRLAVTRVSWRPSCEKTTRSIV